MQSVVQIIGCYEVNNNDNKLKPWDNTNIEKGDILYSLNNEFVRSTEDITRIINEAKEEEISIKLIRNDHYINSKIKIVENEYNKKTIGLYIKDKISGVGTMTFINPNTKRYGALGHGVTGALNKGNLLVSSVQGIKKATSGVPGEKYATLSKTTLGNIEENTEIGIFGEVDSLPNQSTVHVLYHNYVKKGKAQIATVMNGNTIQYYDIEILEVKQQNKADIKGLKIKITDKKLIELSGGIIQGMSGSPIIQNGNLVGAVSHVTVDNPLYGFGVFAEWMFYETQ